MDSRTNGLAEIDALDVLARLGEGVAVLDAEAKVLLTNHAMAEMLGIPEEGIVGAKLDDLLAETELLKVVGCQQLLSTPGVEHMQVVFKNSQGEFVPASVTAATNPGADSRGFRTVLICRDNLEFQELLNDSTRWAAAEIERAERLAVAKAEAERREAMHMEIGQAQKLESIGQLAAGIAHEINTPIQFISDNVAFMQTAFGLVLPMLRDIEQAEDNSAAIAAVHTMQERLRTSKLKFMISEIPRAVEQTTEGIEHVSKIVRAMKEFSHPSSSDMKAIDIHQAIESTVTVARNEWKYVAEIELDFDRELPPVPCHPDAFNQVILNLVINAAHAIADALPSTSEARGRIRIATRHKPPFAEIDIQDSGTGIPSRNLSKIFDPFFTTKEVGKGTGQGLAIAYAVVVRKHGGEISVETAEGQGTTFTVKLPLVPARSISRRSFGASNTSR